MLSPFFFLLYITLHNPQKICHWLNNVILADIALYCETKSQSGAKT